MPPLVTVLIPVFNAERYLRSAVESVLNQTYRELEVVAVDDGSTDSSAEILHELAEADARIVVVRKENGGISSALNRGIASASGRYVTRMDADDLMLPHRIETQIRFLEANPDVGFCASAISLIDEADTDFDTYWPEPTTRASLEGMLTRRELVTYTHPTVTFRIDVARSLGGYRKAYEPCEDTEFFGRFNTSGAPGLVIPEILMRYRVHAGSISRQKAARQVEMAELVRVNFYRRREGLPEHDPGELEDVIRAMPYFERLAYALAMRARVLRQLSKYDRASGRWPIGFVRLGFAALLQPHKAVAKAVLLVRRRSRVFNATR